VPGFLITCCHTPLCIEKFLIPTSLACSVILLAALVRLLAAVVRTASERTVEIPPIGVPRMCQEANRAMTAVDRTACQTGMIAQDRIQRSLILTNKRTGTIVLMPIRAKCKEFPGSYDKNARFSVKMLIVLGTPSSYELDANASRCRARFFSASAKKDCCSDRMTDPSANLRRACRTCANCDVSPSPASSYLERRVSNCRSADPLPLPSSGSI
jgi:hypothetical protein